MALAQKEQVIDKLSNGRKRVRVTLSTLALTSGVAEIKLNTLKEVIDIFPRIVTPNGIDDYAFEYQFIKSPVNVKNGIQITAMQTQTSAVSPTWAVADDTAVAAAVFEIDCIGL